MLEELPKWLVRNVIASLSSLKTAIVSFLGENFENKEYPWYHIKVILEIDLQKKRDDEHHKERDDEHLKVCKTIVGSSDFRVVIFTPHGTTFLASPRLCMTRVFMIMVLGNCSVLMKLQFSN